MSVGTAEKLNSGYISRTYASFTHGMSRAVQKVQAFLASMTRAAGGTYRIGYKKLAEKLNVSKTSIWRSVSGERLGDDFERTRMDGVSKYTYLGDLEEKIGRHVKTECFFYTEIFDGVVTRKGKKIEVERTLYDSEVDVLSLIYSATLSAKGKFEGSPVGIAGILKMNYSTVWRALDYLLAFGLVFRPKKGVNGYDDQSEYVANMKLIRMLKRKHKAPALAEAEAEAQRRAYYQAQEAQRQKRAENYKKQVFQKVPRYREAFLEYEKADRNSAILSAKVELGQASSEKLLALNAQKQVLSQRMREIEARMHIEPVRFHAGFFGKFQCSECQGTGEKKDGKKCDCWLKRQT